MIDTVDDKDPVPLEVTPSAKIEPSPDIGDKEREIGNEEKSFAALMQNKPQAPGAAPEQAAPKVQPVSPFDLASLETRPLSGAAELGMKPIAGPDTESLIRQANLTQNTLGTIQGQLSTPNLKLKASQKYLVKNKLSDANNHLRAANAKMGISPEMPQSEAQPKSATAPGPIAQYLGYVTDGMNQIEAAKKQLSNISTQGANLAPADYMLLQLKFNKAQQELEFTSTVLSKSIEGLKTIMNIQI